MPRPTSQLTPDLGYPLALLAFGALILRPLLQGESFLGGDTLQFSLPMMELQAEAWAAGAVPDWEPRLGLGRPLAADLSFGWLYPLHAIAALLAPLAAFNASLALHLALWLLGIYALARQLGVSPSGAFVAATSHGLGGVGISSLGHLNLMTGLGWAPWCALGVIRAARGGASGWLLAAGCPFALLSTSGAPVDYTLGAGVLAIGCSLAAGASPQRTALCLVPIGLVAVGLAAGSLAPLLAILGDLTRGGGLSAADAQHWSLHPLELVRCAVPQAFWPHGGGLPAAWIGLDPGTRPWYPTLYTGLLPPALVGVAAVRAGRRERALLGVTALALLYALGRHTPLHGWLGQLVPPLGSLRFPAKWLAPASMALALLAGVGWDRLRREPRRVAPWLYAGAGGVALLVALSRGALLERAVLPLVGAALVGVVLQRGWPRRLVPLLLGVELVLAAPFGLWTAPNRLLTEPATLVEPALAAQRAAGAPLRVAALEGSERLRVQLPHVRLSPAASQVLTIRELLTPSSVSVRGVSSVWAFTGIDPARRTRIEAVRRASGLDELEQWRRLGAGLIIHAGAPSPQLEPLARSGPWTLARLQGALPWAAVLRAGVVAADADDALVRALAPGHDPARACVLEADRPVPALAEPAPTRPDVVRLLEREGARLRLEVEAARPGVLVIREAWSRGWRATLDGDPVPVWPADVLFRAVPVPAGRHTLSMHYTAPGRAAGAWITRATLALLALAGLGCAARRLRSARAG